MKRQLGFLLLVAVLWSAVAGSPASAQLSPIPTPEEEGAGPSEELLDLRKRAQELEKRLAEWQAKSLEYERTAREAQSRIEALDQEIALLQKREELDVPEAATRAEIDTMLVTAEQDLAAARAEAMELDQQAQLRTERRRRRDPARP